MRSFDLTPLYRATVGFDQIADLMDRVMTTETAGQSYPPYNIEKTDDQAWRISLAVAGFSEQDLTIEQHENSLHVAGSKAAEKGDRTYLHRGIANRSFKRRFDLADHVRVTAATHENGMLHIDLVREVPEALKPRRIEIARQAVSDDNLVDAKPVN